MRARNWDRPPPEAQRDIARAMFPDQVGFIRPVAVVSPNGLVSARLAMPFSTDPGVLNPLTFVNSGSVPIVDTFDAPFARNFDIHSLSNPFTH